MFQSSQIIYSFGQGMVHYTNDIFDICIVRSMFNTNHLGSHLESCCQVIYCHTDKFLFLFL